jgi:hypothetical protein
VNGAPSNIIALGTLHRQQAPPPPPPHSTPSILFITTIIARFHHSALTPGPPTIFALYHYCWHRFITTVSAMLHHLTFTFTARPDQKSSINR